MTLRMWVQTWESLILTEAGSAWDRLLSIQHSSSPLPQVARCLRFRCFPLWGRDLRLKAWRSVHVPIMHNLKCKTKPCLRQRSKSFQQVRVTLGSSRCSPDGKANANEQGGFGHKPGTPGKISERSAGPARGFVRLPLFKGVGSEELPGFWEQ